MGYLYLAHHGVKGQKWGVRRYQRKDGSLTALGRLKVRRENKQDIADAKKALTSAERVHKVRKQIYDAGILDRDIELRMMGHRKYFDKKHFDRLMEADDRQFEKYDTARKNVDNIKSYIKTLEGTPISKVDVDKAKNGKDFVTTYTKNSIEYKKLQKTTSALYWKRYDGGKLTKQEEKTLNDGYERLDELMYQMGDHVF